MGLRETAEADMRMIIGDLDGFAWSATVIAPDESSASLNVLSNDVSAMIDPDTGLIVTGRTASASIPIADLTAAGLGLPTGIANATSKPWVVEFDDINGTSYTFKVASTQPDRSLGLVVCLLEEYTV